MSGLQDTKVREEFIARCNELHIQAKENKAKLAPPPINRQHIQAKEQEVQLAPPPTNGRHPGHYRAPLTPLSVQSSASTRLSTEQDPYKMELASQEVQSSFERQFGLITPKNQASSRTSSQRRTSNTSSFSDPVASFTVPKPATSRLPATAHEQAIAKCHRELAACYGKLAALHIAEAEGAMLHEAEVAKGQQGYLSNGILQLEVPTPFI